MIKPTSQLGLLLTGLCFLPGLSAQSTDKKPNILFIAVDDLNDYVGFLGGHPQTKTPNMDKLAAEGVVFDRAYCPAALSNPCRTALMTGFRTSTTNVKDNNVNFRAIDLLTNALTIPQYLSANGYYSMQRGKIFHNATGTMSDAISWDLQVGQTGSYGTPVMLPGFRANGIPIGSGDSNFDWGPTSAKLENTPDYGNAVWAANELAKDHDKPFFIGCGFYKPHLPFYVPQEFFDKFPEDSMILPPILDDDLSDVPGNIPPSEDYLQAVQYGKRKAALQAYLAAINYTDTCVGVLLDALRKSKYADNTIVIFWGDHGWHLGEKLRYKKFTPWEEACRMPLIIKVPGVTSAGTRCSIPVNLIDLYPTITELCGIPDNTNNEGESLIPLLKNPDMDYNRVSWTTQGAESIRSDDYRYIRRTQGVELYDHRTDPMEWTNQAANPAYSAVKTRLSFVTDSLLYNLPSEPRSALRKNRIPGVMQAEKFDRGGEGISYHDSDAANTGGKWRKAEGVDIQASNDIGGGFKVTSIADGEWIAFTTDSIKPGRYILNARLTSATAGGAISASLNGSVFTTLATPYTANWLTIKSDTFSLAENTSSDLKFQFTQGGYTINYFEFVRVGDISTSIETLNTRNVIVYPNPTNGILYLNVFEFDTDVTVSLMTMSGKVLWKSGKVSDSVEIPVERSWPQGMALAVVTGKNKTEVQKVMIGR